MPGLGAGSAEQAGPLVHALFRIFSKNRAMAAEQLRTTGGWSWCT